MPIKATPLAGKGGRVAIVDGLRTPFARIATHLDGLNAIDLGAMVVKELMARNNLSQEDIEQLIFGMTVMMPEAPFIGREITLALGYNKIDSYSITRACATSFQTAATLADNIALSYSDIGIAGGTDSTSSARVPLSKEFSRALRNASFAKSTGERLHALKGLKLKDILPQHPSITEYSVGETMGESCEKMVKKWGVTRQEQDEIAHLSHTNAAKAWAEGRLDRQVMTAFIGNKATPLKEDNLVRKNSKLDSYAKLKPVFDKLAGTVTAGNASPLTDGAGALLMMSEEKAKALGYKPLGYLRSYAFAAKTPWDDLLMGPVLAAPQALARAGLSLADMTIIDMHEAFAGQIACNLKGLADKNYIPEHTGLKALGEVDRSKLNVNGGSIAYGHPFGATGARIISQSLYELQRQGGGLALTTACAAGGLGVAMVLEAE